MRQRVCAILTADCLPILITGTKGCKIAAVHAGWRGLAGIINYILLQCLKAPPNDLLVWLGARYRPLGSEVGEEVRQAFLNRHTDYQKAFTTHKDDRSGWLTFIS